MVPPHELKSVEFTRGIRGYTPQEVDEQIEYLMTMYEKLYAQTSELVRENKELKSKYAKATVERDQVRHDLRDAKTASEQIINEAKEKADMIIRASKTNCDFIINDYRRIVAEEREKLVQAQARIQLFKESMLNQCREYMDAIDDMTELAHGSSLYYSSDDELVARAIDEIKTDVRYAMAEKAQHDSITDDEIAVDLDYFNEEPIEDDVDMTASAPTGIFTPDAIAADMEKTIIIPDTGSVTDAVPTPSSDTRPIDLEELKELKAQETKSAKMSDKYMEFLDELDSVKQ